MRQRAAFLRTLLCHADILLLDEPFSAMDTYLREGLRLELSKVLADYDGVSVMVTHDRDEAFQLCKNIMLLDKGHVLIAGNSRKIFQDPVTCKAARLTGCKNISKIERIGEYRVRALDWDNLEFVTDRTVGDDITAIGIRAHDFEPLAGEEVKAKKEAGEENLIPVVDPSISEMPFEWYITLSNGLWWKKEKTIHTHDAAGVVPEYLRADPSAILLLKGEL
jgi:molybdate transport system ATP-binding protein